MKRLIGLAAVLAAAAFGTAALADSSASTLPPNWHVHDGHPELGPQHKGVGFFPTILGEDLVTYQQDPAACPNATDKAFLPSADTSNSDVLRAGVCMTSTTVIHLRTVPIGTAGPAGWSSITSPKEPGYITYYLLTPR